jgi:hypothetical protein
MILVAGTTSSDCMTRDTFSTFVVNDYSFGQIFPTKLTFGRLAHKLVEPNAELHMYRRLHVLTLIIELGNDLKKRRRAETP